MTRISTKIMEIRKYNLAVSQEEFGKRIGASKNYVCQLERGRKTPGFSVLYKISVAVGIDQVKVFHDLVDLLAQDYLALLDKLEEKK